MKLISQFHVCRQMSLGLYQFDFACVRFVIIFWFGWVKLGDITTFGMYVIVIALQVYAENSCTIIIIKFFLTNDIWKKLVCYEEIWDWVYY